MQVVLVVGGDAKQASHWIFERSPEEHQRYRYVVVSRAVQLYGYRQPLIACVGTWYEQREMAEVFEIARARGYKDYDDARA